MTASIVSRYLVLALLFMVNRRGGAQQVYPMSSELEDENHNMLRRHEPSIENEQQRRELWGFSNLLYHLGVCPGPQICGPPPCHIHGPHPEHWHCDNSTSASSSTTQETYNSGSSSTNNTSVYSQEVTDKSAGKSQSSTSSANYWMYIAGAAGLTALVAGVAYRKRYATREVEGDHLLHGSLGKRLGFMRGGSKLPALPDSPPPSFIEMATAHENPGAVHSGISTDFVKL